LTQISTKTASIRASRGPILTSAVDSWSRLSSKRIAPEIQQALSGAYDFAALEQLLTTKEEGVDED
jgi:hypothetical protein